MTEATFDAAELHARARNRNAVPPPEFRRAVARVTKAEQALTDAFIERDDLIREARTLGVSWAALARWTGISARRIYEIVEDR